MERRHLRDVREEPRGGALPRRGPAHRLLGRPHRADRRELRDRRRAGPARAPRVAGQPPALGRRRMRRPPPAPLAAVTATAAAGVVGTDVRSPWYAALD